MTDMGVDPTGATTGITMTPGGLSPDGLLAYCQMQLNELDGEISDQMNLQQKQLAERNTLEKVQLLLNSSGADGPLNADQMQTLVDNIQGVIDGIKDDPSLQSLLQQTLSTMTSAYQFTAQTTISVPEKNSNGTYKTDANGNVIEDQENVGPTMKTNPDDTTWQSTLGTFSSISDQIKSEADIGMLTLQDLVSQRQQAVQLSMGIMDKDDQTLENESKAIGQ